MEVFARYVMVHGKKLHVGDYCDGVFTKRVKSSKHLFRKGNAYAISEKALFQIDKMGCKKIVIKEMEQKETLEVDFGIFMSASWRNSVGGYDIQRFLAKKWFTITSKSGAVVQNGAEIKPVDINNVNQQKLL